MGAVGGTAGVGFRPPGLPRPVAWAAAVAAAGTVAQVPLGAVTVAFDLNPWLVMSHFLLAMAVVAVFSWVTFHAVDLVRGGRPRPARLEGPGAARAGGRLPVPGAGATPSLPGAC